MKIVWAAVLLMSSLLANIVSADTERDEAEAIATLEGFFSAFSVERYPNPDIRNWITDDFLIFEMGEAFSWSDFEGFLENAGYRNWISTDWEFSDLRVSLSDSAAHISYVNEGEFVYPDPGDPDHKVLEKNRWLESVYLVEEGGRLKIKFLQSDNVTREITPLP